LEIQKYGVNGLSVQNLKEFQNQVSELLLRHRSLLDVLSKYQQSNSSVNRSVIKSVTECGCVEVNAKKQEYNDETTRDQASQLLGTHMSGQPCDHCLEVIGAELGKNLFYMSALCNLLQIDLQEVVESESKKCSTLGFFNMS
jgi:NTP pyrophosphatase (non-canonical NTP hydrolase)